MNEIWHPDIPQEYRNAIVTGDARLLAERIPDESIDLILCDPVYTQLDDYRWLADLAAQVLKPGHSIVAETGQIYRFQAECALQHPDLQKRPLITEVFMGGFRTIWKDKALKANNSYIWLEKGSPNGRGWIRTCFWGSMDKKHHIWGDGIRAFSFMIESFTQEGHIILDPFTGGGTVPTVCKMLQRNYIAFEIDPDTAELARERVRNTQPPLPLQYHKQMELI